MTHDDDRINYLAAEGGGSLPVPERAELDELRALLAAPATWADPDPGLEDRIVAAITEEAATRPSSTPVRRPARARRRPVWRWRPYSLVAVASAGLAALVIVVGSIGQGAEPERFAMVVSGTSLAPRAHGSATLTKTRSGWRVDLTVTGLPHIANGRYYQAWLRDAAGILVPVGTFNDALRVTLWSGVPVTRFRSLTVTQQQADGDPASSGRRVLTGTIRTR